MSTPFISEVCFGCQASGVYGDFVEVVFPANYTGDALTVSYELTTSNRTLTSTLRPAAASTCVVVLARTVSQTRPNLIACTQCDFAGSESRKLFLLSPAGVVLDVLATNANQSNSTQITVFRNTRLSPAAFGTAATPFLDGMSREFPCGLTSSTTTSSSSSVVSSSTTSTLTTSRISSLSSSTSTTPVISSESTTISTTTTSTIAIAPTTPSSSSGGGVFFTPSNAAPVQAPFPLIPVAAGAAGGGLVLIVLIVLLVCCLMRRKKNEDLIYSERGGVGSSSIAMVEQSSAARAGVTDGVYKGELPQNRSSTALGDGDDDDAPEQPYGFIPKRSVKK
jgi:hypothetical protein